MGVTTKDKIYVYRAMAEGIMEGDGVYQSLEGFCITDGLDYRTVSQRKAPNILMALDF